MCQLTQPRAALHVSHTLGFFSYAESDADDAGTGWQLYVRLGWAGLGWAGLHILKISTNKQPQLLRAAVALCTFLY